MTEAGPPRVSVVMIFLDAKRYIAEAVATVVAQTYRDWELVLVDDGSTDGSAEVATRVANDPRRTLVLSHDRGANRGMSASRNLGIAHARGECVAFLDADDVWLPQKLERQVGLLDENPEAAMLYGRTLRWFSWTGSAEDRDHDFVRDFPHPTDTIFSPPRLVPDFLRQRGVPCITSVIVRRDAIARVGGFEEEFRAMYEDQVFFTKMALHEPIYVSSRCWDRYRKHDDSTCAVAQQRDEIDAARDRFLAFVDDYVSRRGIVDAGVRHALDEQRGLPASTTWRTTLARSARRIVDASRR